MLENATHILQHICSLHPELPVVVGVSGGPDSICLLDLLLQCGYQVVVAHLNHGLRPGADDEEQRLESYAGRLGIRFLSSKIDVRAVANLNGISVEEGAREVRYRFLFDVAAVIGAQAVAVGHHADDQVETVLMHLLRGAGLAGLRGMEPRLLPNPWSTEVPLVRPLLNVRRTEILDYLERRGLPYEIDESNTDTSYFRNRLRHELIPYLASYNPEISRSILRMAELLRGEYAVVEAAVETASQECLYRVEPGYVILSANAWHQQLTAIQRSLLRRAIAWLKPGLRDIDYALIDRAMTFIQENRLGNRYLGNGIYIILDPGDLYITTDPESLPVDAWPQIQPGMQVELEIPGEFLLKNGWRLKASQGIADLSLFAAARNPDEQHAWVDLDTIPMPLVVRSRQPGDRLQVLGMGGRSAKLSDLMINARLPRRARQGWPVVVSGGEVVWVPGIRMSERHRITPNTKHSVLLELRKE